MTTWANPEVTALAFCWRVDRADGVTVGFTSADLDLTVAGLDPAQSWLHIDPATGELLNRSGSASRSYRWLFSALHSFDLPWLLILRPLRDALMWLLSAAGLFISISGIVVGWRYLRRGSNQERQRKGRATP